MGGDAIFERLKEHLDVGNDETTGPPATATSRSSTSSATRACDYAPVMTVNWEFMDNMTPSSATQLVDDLRAGVEVSSTRGPRLCTWREAERVLAGFPDDRADEGPSAGAASLVGLELARERGWSAPAAEQGRRQGEGGRTPRAAALPRSGRPSRPTPAVPSPRRRSRTPRPASSTRTTPATARARSERSSGERADRHGHADPGPHPQLGHRPELDAGGLRGAGRVRRAAHGVRDDARTRSSRRSRTPACAAAAARASRPA